MVTAGCDVPHASSFGHCMGRLFSSPSPHMAAEIALLRARLPVRYTALHIRTFGADMHIPKNTTPEPNATLRFLSWEVTLPSANRRSSEVLSPHEYARELRRHCGIDRVDEPDGGVISGDSVYVAADSRAAVMLVKQLCPHRVLLTQLSTPPSSLPPKHSRPSPHIASTPRLGCTQQLAPEICS